MSQDASFDAPRPALFLTVALAFVAVLAGAIGPITATGSLADALAASDADLLAIIAMYPAFVAVLLLPLGRFGQRFGPYRALLIGLGVFSLANLGSAIAETTLALIILRAVAGLGAALIVPTAVAALLQARLDAPAGIGRRLWPVTMATATGVGLLLAAVIGGRPGWSWVFVSVFVVAAVAMMIDLTGEPEAAPDAVADQPLLDRGLFGHWANAIALGVVLLTAGLVAGSGLRVVTHLQREAETGAAAAVAALLPIVIAAAAGLGLGPRLLARIGLAQALALACAVLALALAVLALANRTTLGMALPLLALGLGAGLALGPAASASPDLAEPSSNPGPVSVAIWAGATLGLVLFGFNDWNAVFTGGAAAALVAGTAIYVFALRTAATRTVRSRVSAGQERTDAAVA